MIRGYDFHSSEAEASAAPAPVIKPTAASAGPAEGLEIGVLEIGLALE